MLCTTMAHLILLWRKQIEDVSVDKENTKTQLQAIRTDTSHMRLKQQQVEKEVSKEIPQNKVCVGCHHGGVLDYSMLRNKHTRPQLHCKKVLLRSPLSLLMYTNVRRVCCTCTTTSARSAGMASAQVCHSMAGRVHEIRDAGTTFGCEQTETGF